MNLGLERDAGLLKYFHSCSHYPREIFLTSNLKTYSQLLYVCSHSLYVFSFSRMEKNFT